ncbi:MAG: hypothetical protein JWQ63_901 [Mucilaginibacter sp.]|nr:hypothetical protein [Mucilaginibacter sp.]
MRPQLFDTKKKLKWIPYGYLFILFFTISPFLGAFLANVIGNSLGCDINEGGTDECIRIGVPFGEVLNGMVAAGWLFFLTIPLGAIFLIILTFVAINDSNYFKKH